MKSREKFMARNKRLDRFHNAQNSNTCGYDQAFSENTRPEEKEAIGYGIFFLNWKI